MLALLVVATSTTVAHAHDPSRWGGIYRSRDHGATWFLANEGRFVTAALDLAVDPADPTHLLLGTESGLLRSHNGGRDWEVAGRDQVVGAVFAVAFDAGGRRALVSAGGGLSAWDPPGGADEDGRWRGVSAPAGAAPARAMMAGRDPGRVYLAGWNGLFRSDDWGASWSDIAVGLPEGPVRAIAVTAEPEEMVAVVAAGGLWASTDGGRTWLARENGLPAGYVESVAADPYRSARLWAGGADRLFRSDDQGLTWHAVGSPLGEPNTGVRGIAVGQDERTIILTTDRGLFRSIDGAITWELLVDELPAHLEARPLVRDPRDPATLYAGFSITPYDGLWQSAADGRNALARLDALNLAGGAAFVVLLTLAGGWALRRLARYYGPRPDLSDRPDAHPNPSPPVPLAGRALR
jgi:photosystem II stability/assembly factor-like uncharacterized protein